MLLAVWIFWAATCGLLTACGSSVPRGKPVTDLDLQINARENVNPDEQGRAAPIMVRVYELRSPTEFENADFFSLQTDGKKMLGDDVLEVDEFVLRPGYTRTIRRTSSPGVTAIGVLAGYRELGQSVWRAVYRLNLPTGEGWRRALARTPESRLKINVGERAVSITEWN